MAPHDRKRTKVVRNPPEGLKELIQQPTNVGTANGYLERLYDPGLRLPRTDRSRITAEEIERLCHALALVKVAGSIPRRLGFKATDEELALDKKRARRVGHALRQSLDGWTRDPKVEFDDEVIRREGAQLEWLLFSTEHIVELRAR